MENGFPTTTLNWAEVSNKGFEVNLTTRNVQNRDFSWTTNFNISKNLNKVNKIHINENQATPSIEGHSVNSLFAIKTAGLDADGYPLFWKDGEKVSVKEYFQLEAMWGIPDLVNTTLSNQELRDLYTHVGSTDPKLSGGFINNFRYKNFSLNVSMSFNLKQWVKETPFYSMSEFDRGINTTSKVNQIWSPSNPGGKYPAIVGPYSYNGSRAEEYYWMAGSGKAINAFRDLDIWYKEISYLRISSIRLGYDIPEAFAKRIGIKGARVNVEARNPFVFGTNFDGYFDPETYGNIYAQPMQKSISVGLNVNF